MTDLSGPWALADETGTYGCEIRLPGEDGITALHRAGLIPDPYWGRNEYSVRWICERDWTARRSFELDDTNVVLVLGEVDCVVDLEVNGVPVRRLDNQFRTWRIDLSEVARAGSNEIAVTFRSPVREAAARQAALPFRVPYNPDNSPIPNGNMLRKVQCDFGWDWNVALAPFGIYGDLHLADAGACRIHHVEVEQEHGTEGVTLRVRVDAVNAEGMACRIALGAEHREATVRDSICEVTFELPNDALWWPNGLGAPTLHDLSLEVGGARVDKRVALRDVRLVTEPDAAGLGFKLAVNGRDVFARGANWIPADALPGLITEAATRDLLQSAAAAHMNMIRVWGGGRYEPLSFYEACDELGLLVWQDFMFACNLYPATPEFLDSVAAEVREQVQRLAPHVALWCGDNELIGALGWYDESRRDRDRYLVAYDRLNRTIEDALRAADPGANWWPSSPSPGPLNFGDAWHDDGSGDMHFWSVWHEGRDFEHYRDVSPRFCSEFGFQSYPSMEVIRTFADPADWNIASPVLESHQKNAGGNARIAETMFRYFRWPERFEDFVWLSQLQQALAIKTAVTAWRVLKPHCMGTLYWQLNDTWPVCSWSSLDYGGGWKLLHHFARDFYRPVTVVAVPQGETLRFVGINDGLAPVELSVAVYATAMDGTARPIGEGRGAVGAKAVPLAAVALDALPTDEVVTFGWQSSDGARGGDIHAPRRWKEFDLPDPEVAMDVAREDGRHVLSLTAKAMAFFLTAEADVPGRWDRNAVHLGPGHTTRLSFTPREASARPAFALRHLQSATMARR